MLTQAITTLGLALPLVYGQQRQASSDETVLGAYVFHRHGDRTPKVLAPTNLTDLGYRQVYDAGAYYRSRYVDAEASSRIAGISSDEVLHSQIQTLAPDDDVLMQSALGFLQALYPPVGVNSETLANGTTVDAPMDGYQIIPVGQSDTGAGSEDAGWLQSTSECAKAMVSSNEYYTSVDFNEKLESTRAFYERLAPVIGDLFTEDERNFDNAYAIYDYINVAEIHNSSIPSSDLLTDEVLIQLRTLADNHEWNLAFNGSSEIRAISGSQLAAEITQFLNDTIEAAGSHSGSKLGIQFGAYATFMSFFGLAGLPEVNGDFTGVTDYASSMVFELFTRGSNEDDMFVRFLYHNGTASNASEPQVYPLFGSGQDELSWDDFLSGMNKFSIGDTESWCTVCGNSTGECAAYAAAEVSSTGSTGSDASGGCSNGPSPAVNGVIGAMVTLAVVLGLQALIMLVGGFRVVRKTTLTRAAAVAETTKI